MAGAKETVLLLVVVVCWASAPGEATSDADSKLVIDRLEEAELSAQNPKVSYAERKFKDGLTSDAEAEDGDSDGEEVDDDEDATDDGGLMSKFSGPQDKRKKYGFRSDLGKRNHLLDYEPEFSAALPSKRYRSFKADLGKRYSRFRSDLGKRLDMVSSIPAASLGELEYPDGEKFDPEAIYPRPDKRPKFRADLGKRVKFEASRRVFRADLGKRRMFRSDLG